MDLSPRKVLAMLNENGVRNITAPQLKFFMTDLKKLIRQDNLNAELAKKDIVSPEIKTDPVGPERLYSYSTISSRSKCVSCNKSNSTKNKKNHSINNICPKHKSAAEHNLKSNQTNVKPESTHCRFREIQRNVSDDKENIPIRNTLPRKMKSSKNFIKVPVGETQKKSDPVSLYHHYSSLWEKYKTHIPGENNWANLRWSIREKLMGEREIYDNRKVGSLSEEELAKRREGWID